ncbi:unnamed protein product [Pleuronectes platessa]|uniref:Uncharacterized protein n=1 Tax=Pleuronectes platessa TaxID=8262 RepID=A0A9N7V169_PLEPL|nr:unnamed protein product [Pleuronectes platessa]
MAQSKPRPQSNRESMADLKIAVHRRSPSNLTELHLFCQEEWTNLPSLDGTSVRLLGNRLEKPLKWKSGETKEYFSRGRRPRTNPELWVEPLPHLPHLPHRPLPLPQDGWLYQTLQAGGGQVNPVPAEIGLRHPRKRQLGKVGREVAGPVPLVDEGGVNGTGRQPVDEKLVHSMEEEEEVEVEKLNQVMRRQD